MARVLVVEDEDTIRNAVVDVIKRCLKEAVVISEGALDGAMAYPVDDFDLVIADFNLGRTETSEGVVGRYSPHSKVLLMSGNEEVGERWQEMGAHAFLLKPVSVGRLISAVNELLAA